MSRERLGLSGVALSTLTPDELKWATLPSSYLTKMIYHANRLGLAGKKIVELIGVEEQSATGQPYLDFLCEP